MLPANLQAKVESALSDASRHVAILSGQILSGGCIHHALKLETSIGLYFLKWNPDSLPGMFCSEASGLETIRAAKAVRTPLPLLYEDSTQPGSPGFILLEWVESGGIPFDPAILGEQMANLHRSSSPTRAYGLDYDNFLGPNLQPNHWSKDWTTYFRDQRLAPQRQLAIRKRNLPPSRLKRLDSIMDHLDQFLSGVERQPSLVHGDLWAGNILANPQGVPVLIDPAVYYADREVELAYTQLFGGFPQRFYQAYSSAWPLQPGYEVRREIYNLYHLLNHLNIFGEEYGAHVDAILKRYAAV